MRTKFEQDNADYSERAHQAAQRLIYPDIFNVPFEDLRFETMTLDETARNQIYDGELAIDRIVYVPIKPRGNGDFNGPLKITVQERFRQPEWAHNRDATITEFNYASDQLSELYKITSGYFLYAYYDEVNFPENDKRRFLEAVLINVPNLQLKLLSGELPYSFRFNKKEQRFVIFKFMDLARLALIAWHWSACPDGYNLKQFYTKPHMIEMFGDS